MADGVVMGCVVGPENFQICRENASEGSFNTMKMLQEASEANSYLDMEDSSCFSKCSGDESSPGPTSHNFSSDYCGEKDDEMPSSEGEDSCRKKRCSDRYDSAESSDSGIAVSSGSSSSDITDPGSPFSTSSDDSTPAKLSSGDPGSPIMAPSVTDCPASLPASSAACPKSALAARSPLFPASRAVRASRCAAESRVKRRIPRRLSPADTQGKITEYFKSQSKPMVGIKRDFNYLKKEPFSIVDSSPKRIVVEEKLKPTTITCNNNNNKKKKILKKNVDDDDEEEEEDLKKLPFALARLRPPAKTLLNKILHNHKQRKIAETFLKTRTEAIIPNDDDDDAATDMQPKKKKTDTPLYVDCGTENLSSKNINCIKSPILTVPKTIRFPALDSTKSNHARDELQCQWDGCRKVCDASGPLLEHLQTSHVVTQGRGEKFVCLWVGCKVYNQKSCSRSWLERHVLLHAGNKPFRCIVEGCGLSFSSQTMLTRHINQHFEYDSKKQLDNSGSAKLIRKTSKKVRWRLQPLAARTFDFFDDGMLHALEHRFSKSTWARTGGDLTNSRPHSVTLKSEMCGTRVLPSGEKQFLIRWHPRDVVDDEWLSAADVTCNKYVPYHKIPHSVKIDLAHEWGVFRPGRPGRKMKPVPPPPPSLPSPPIAECLPRVEISPPTVEQFLITPQSDSTTPSSPSSSPSTNTTTVEKVKLKRTRSSLKLKCPIDPNSLPVVTIPVVDIVKKKQVQDDLVPAAAAAAATNVLAPVNIPTTQTNQAPTTVATTATSSTSFILNNQQFKLVSQPFLNAMLPVPLTYQLQPQMQPQMQQPVYFLPPSPAPMFQTIHFSSNIVQQQSILATMNIQKSPTLLLLNTTKQVNVNLTQERPKQKVQILPKPECLMSIHPS